MAETTKKHSLLVKRRKNRVPRAPRPKRDGQSLVTQHELRGGKLDVPPNPPNVAYQPWNNLTVVHSGQTGELTVKVSDLAQQIGIQIDPIKSGLNWGNNNKTTTAYLNFKLQKVRAWNLTGQMIALSVDDFSDESKAIADVDALCGLVDTGAASHTPAVGYDLPATHRAIVHRAGASDKTDKDVVLYHVMAPGTDTILIYTTVLWKFDGPAKFSAFESSMLETVRSIARNTAQISRDTSTLESIAVDVQKAQSKLGIGSFIANGLEVAAPYIIPAVGALEDKLTKIHEELAKLNLQNVGDDVLLKDWVTSLSDAPTK